MDNPNISETSREKLEDAAAFVIMEQYAKALNAGINKQMEDCAEEDFPEELDKRCRALIAQASRKAQNKKRRKSALRVLRSAAVVALVMLSLCSVLFVSVDAFRIPVLNFFTEKTERYWQLRGNANKDTIPNKFNPENPLEGIIPDSFILNTISGEWSEGYLSVNYSDEGDATISFIAFPAHGQTHIDTQGATAVSYKVLDYDAVKSVEDQFVRITWLDADKSLIFTICTTNVAEDIVEVYATSTALLIG